MTIIINDNGDILKADNNIKDTFINNVEYSQFNVCISKDLLDIYYDNEKDFINIIRNDHLKKNRKNLLKDSVNYFYSEKLMERNENSYCITFRYDIYYKNFDKK